jgi:alkylation response protein AidB-like acyl-CoA dehydrogenase
VISFALTEEQRTAREAMHDFAAEAMRPIARECDETAGVPDDFLQTIWELGLTSTQIPRELGGGGEESSSILNVLILEELAWGDASLALAALAPSLFVGPLLDFGTEEQKKRYLPPFSGKQFQAASLAIVEPGPVFDPHALATTATRTGDRYVLSGAKSFVPFAERAQHFLVMAREKGSNQVFIVARETSGVAVSAAEQRLGLKALPTATVTLSEVAVPLQDRLGGEGGCNAQRLLDSCRAALAATLVGLSRGVMEYAIPYSRDRVAFGEPIARKQAIAFKLSDMRVETDAMRHLAWKASSLLDKKQDATKAAHFARAYAAEHAMKIADDGVQVLGGHGFIREHPVEMWYRNARTLGVLEGTAIV